MAGRLAQKSDNLRTVLEAHHLDVGFGVMGGYGRGWTGIANLHVEHTYSVREVMFDDKGTPLLGVLTVKAHGKLPAGLDLQFGTADKRYLSYEEVV